MKTIQIKTMFIGMLLLVLASTVIGENDTEIPTRSAAVSSDKVVTIKITGLKFVPAELTIEPGTLVRWVNIDPIDHDVTSGESIIGRKARELAKTKFPDGVFSSGLFGNNQSYEYTFQKSGEYAYYCNIHPFMIGTIKVK